MRVSLIIVVLSGLCLSRATEECNCGKPPSGDGIITPDFPDSLHQAPSIAGYTCKPGYRLACADNNDMNTANVACKRSPQGCAWEVPPSCERVENELPVHNQKLTTSNYLFQPYLPAMSEITACFWFEGRPQDANREDDWFLSIAVPGEDNELLIGWRTGTGKVTFGVRSVFKTLELPAGVTMGSLWTGWNKHCFTWKAGGEIKWYTDRDESGKVELVSTVAATASTVRPKGYMTLLQEQDSIGGGFALHQTTVGKIADFNLWDREMTSAAEINQETCGNEGNVASWDTLREQGSSPSMFHKFPLCKAIESSTVYVQTPTTRNYLYQTGLPAMSELTTCFWFEGRPQDANRKGDWLISLAIPGEDNEFFLGWRDRTGKLTLGVRDIYRVFTLPAGETMGSLWTGWNKHCFTWKAGGHIKWYTDVTVHGKVELVSTVFAASVTIRPGGYMTLLQEQDAVGGRFNLNQVAVGKISEFQLWNHEMTYQTINQDSCFGIGNIVSWNTLQEAGTAAREHKLFPKCSVVPPATVFVQAPTTSNYLYQDGLPAMTEFTTCFWFEGRPQDANRKGDWLLSLAIPGQDNEFFLGWRGPNGKLSLGIRNVHNEFTLPTGVTMGSLFTGWNKHCFTWKAGGQIKWYTDRLVSGHVELFLTLSAAPSTIRAGGYMALLQEQDSVGGGFDVNQVAVGKISEFNMWDYEASANAINQLSCRGSGDVVSWDGLKEVATSVRQHKIFPECSDVPLADVYVQENTMNKFLYQPGLPAMSEFTTCFWFEGRPQDADRKDDWLLSIAVPGQDNELLIGWRTGTGKVTFGVRSVFKTLELPAGVTMGSLWTGWNKHCFTWKAGGQIKWYTDRNVPGKVELVSTVSATTGTVRATGFMTLLQEQDSVGGGFDASQLTVGKIAEFNMWDYEMTSARQIDQACENHGNVASWDTLLEYGSTERQSTQLPSCPATPLTKAYTQGANIRNYLYQSRLPSMSQFTVCFWFKGRPQDANRKDDWLISGAIPSEDNEFFLGWRGDNGKFTFGIRDAYRDLELPPAVTMGALWTGWNKHCLTWKSRGQIKWYTDRGVSGEVELVSSASATTQTIRAGSYMTLLQEQDSFGGRLNVNQVAVGKLAEFNMWNYEMKSAEEINRKTCRGQGNIVSDETLQKRGNPPVSFEPFPQC